MRLVYDNIVFALQRFGGISVVWQELLSKMQPQRQFQLEYIDIDNESAKNPSRERLQLSPESIIGKTSQCIKLSRYLPVRLQSDEPFLFHSSYYRYCTNPKAINITTVHDFTYELFVKGIKQKVHSWQKFSAIRHSACTVCISENTKRDLLRLLPDVDESRVRVIYNGVSEVFRVVSGCQCDLPYPTGSYVVFIGRRDGYKNFGLTVRSVAATQLNLLIIGGQLTDEEKAQVEHILPPHRYKCMSHIPDEQLNLFYNHAAALVYPSSYEGFGIPVLEAQRAGCPVIAYNASSIPEVIGSTPLLMQTLTEKEMVGKLQLLSNDQLMAEVRANGLANTQRFSWQRMGDEYMKIYEEFAR